MTLQNVISVIERYIYIPLHDIRNELLTFATFVKSRRALVAIIAVGIILAYSIKLFWFDYSIDSEVGIDNYKYLLHSWDTVGRFGLILIKKMFFPVMYNPALQNILTYCTLLIAGLVLCYLWSRIEHKKQTSFTYAIFALLFVTSPIFADMLNFSIMSFEITFSILLVTISGLCIYLYSQSRKIFWIVAATLLAAFSFTIYQALPQFFIALVLFIIILTVNNGKKITPIITAGTISLIGALVIYGTAPHLYAVLKHDTSVLQNTYLLRQIKWGHISNQEAIHNITNSISNVFFAKGYFYSYALLLSACGSALVILYNLIFSRKRKQTILELVYFIGLYLTPFGLIILMADIGVIRTEMPTIQFVAAAGVYYAMTRVSRVKVAYYGVAFIAIILIINQIVRTSDAFFSEHMKYNEDVALSQRIITRLDNMGFANYSGYHLLVFGAHISQIPIAIHSTGDQVVLGQSFYQWDLSLPFGASNRIAGFLESQGYDFPQWNTSDTLEMATVAKLKNEYKNLQLWPESNSLAIDQVDKVIILRLS